MASVRNENQPAPKNVEQESSSTVSEHKTNTTENPKKNSPRRRRRWNSFAPNEHGLLVTKVADLDGKCIPAIENLCASLIYRFDPGQNDPVSQLLVELVVADYWRMSQVVRYEKLRSGGGPDLIFCGYGISEAMKYLSLTRRNLDKGLETLLQLEKEAEAARELEASLDLGEAQAAAAAAPSQPESPSPPAQSDEPPKATPTSRAAEMTTLAGEGPGSGTSSVQAGNTTAVAVPTSPTDGTSAETIASAREPAESAAGTPGGATDVDVPEAA